MDLKVLAKWWNGLNSFFGSSYLSILSGVWCTALVRPCWLLHCMNITFSSEICNSTCYWSPMGRLIRSIPGPICRCRRFFFLKMKLAGIQYPERIWKFKKTIWTWHPLFWAVKNWTLVLALFPNQTSHFSIMWHLSSLFKSSRCASYIIYQCQFTVTTWMKVFIWLGIHNCENE